MDSLHVVLSTSAVALVTGIGLGFYSARGYIIPPELKAERYGNQNDPLESEESDIDEDDTILDHAPNWANGFEADRRDGLRQRQAPAAKKQPASKKKLQAEKQEDEEEEPEQAPIQDSGKNEECKLVLVVRTDLGMTKGRRR